MIKGTVRGRVCQGKRKWSEDIPSGRKCHMGEASGREIQEPVQSSCIPGINPCLADSIQFAVNYVQRGNISYTDLRNFKAGFERAIRGRRVRSGGAR